MKVKDVLPLKGTNVVTIEVDKSVHDAICKLNAHRIGALVVTGEGNEVCGIITERDILRECGQRCTRLEEPAEHGHSPCPALIKDVMTKDVIIGVLDDDLGYVMRVMTKNHIRHLPILEGGELAGIVSIGDVVNAQVEAADFENRMLKDYVEGRTY